MGEITIKVPQKIRRTFRIDSPSVADEILHDLERYSEDLSAKHPHQASDFKTLRELIGKYRDRPDEETRFAIETANDWRSRW